MSFLNPTTEQVKVYRSTDNDAPIITNAGSAGMIKTIFKACLVTGYGSKTGAGWNIEEDANNVNIATFASPNPIMSRYKLHIDDTSTSTVYSYMEDGTKKSFRGNTLRKNYTRSNKWVLAATSQGFWFVEGITEAGSITSSRLSYFGRVKSALSDDMNTNFTFISLGEKPSYGDYPQSAIKQTPNTILQNLNSLYQQSNAIRLLNDQTTTAASVVDIVDDLFICSGNIFAAKIPGIKTVYLADAVNNIQDLHEFNHNNKPCLYVYSSYDANSSYYKASYYSVVYIKLDVWEY